MVESCIPVIPSVDLEKSLRTPDAVEIE